MGAFRVYPSRPTLIPSGDQNIYSAIDAPTLENSENAEGHDASGTVCSKSGQPEITAENLYSAFSSPTAGLLMCWHYLRSNAKSAGKLNQLWSYITQRKYQYLGQV
jgi:hypothetical protein